MSISRLSLCSFTFADGRRCRTPRCSKHPDLCYFHAKKDAEARSLQEIGFDIGTWLTGNYVSACDLSAALGRVFSNAAQGKIKPRTAATLGYLGQTMAQLIPRAQLEYVNAYGTDAWRAAIRDSVETELGPPSGLLQLLRLFLLPLLLRLLPNPPHLLCPPTLPRRIPRALPQPVPAPNSALPVRARPSNNSSTFTRLLW